MPDTPFSLYIHIPFCRKKCSYCDFNTYAGLDGSFGPYTAALCRELAAPGAFRRRPPVSTIFIGGGTPTVLPIKQLADILAACRAAFDVLPQAEITSEANPGAVDEACLRDLLSFGVNRFSFGAQSFNEAELTMLGRIHAAADIGKTVAAARRAGAQNLNLDLIYGLPRQTLRAWRHTLLQAVALQPDHLSLYSLTLERGTALRAQVARGELPPPDTDLAADMYELAAEVLQVNGYAQYEISNWCKPGRACRHNLTYWRNLPYLGFGPGAHSFAEKTRWWNVRPVPTYINRLAALEARAHPRPAMAGSETIDIALEMGETMMLGLRLTAEGVSTADFETRFNRPVTDVFGPQIKKLKALGLLTEDSRRLKLTPAARLVGNLVFAEFLPGDM